MYDDKIEKFGKSTLTVMLELIGGLTVLSFGAIVLLCIKRHREGYQPLDDLSFYLDDEDIR